MDTKHANIHDSEGNSSAIVPLIDDLYHPRLEMAVKRVYLCNRLKLMALIAASFMSGILLCKLSSMLFSNVELPASCSLRKSADASSPEEIPRLRQRPSVVVEDDVQGYNMIVLYGESVWTKYDLWQQADWKKCPERHSNCRITTNLRVLDDDKTKVKAIVFNAEKMPSGQDIVKFKHHIDSFKVFMSGITPQQTKFLPGEYQQFFEVTMTYKEGSHIRIPYWPNDGKLPSMFRAKEKGHEITEEERLDIEEDLPDYFQRYGKEDFMGYTIKNCSEQLFSNLFVRKLREEGLIVTYAVESSDKCLGLIKDTVPLPCRYGWDSDECVKILEQFKFFIVPEADVCVDYVGKDYWYAILAWHAVPIMYGGADVTKFLIPGSYINTLEEEYISPTFKKAYSVSNDALSYYKAFHWWRHEDRLEEFYWQCELCEYINKHLAPSGSYVDMASFWDPGRDCGRSTKAHDLMRAQLVRTGVISGS